MTFESAMLVRADLARIESDAAALTNHTQLVMPASMISGGEHHGTSFADVLKNAVHAVDGKEHVAAGRMAAVDSGRSDDLVGAMLSSQEASLSFSMLMQVRNKVMGAVDELIKLQV